jgi:PAS domain S-box-containing protein
MDMLQGPPEGETTSDMAQGIGAFDDGSRTPPHPADWPAEMAAVWRLIQSAAVPMLILWGPDGLMFYNDAYARLVGDLHPAQCGAPVEKAWPAAASLFTRIAQAGRAGETSAYAPENLDVPRHGRSVTVSLEMTASPLRDATGTPRGTLVILRDMTVPVREAQDRAAQMALLQAAESRQRYLVELGDRLRAVDSEAEIARVVADVIGRSLGCTRAGYALVRDGCAVVENDWTDGTLGSLCGVYDFSLLGEVYTSAMQRGEILVVPDVHLHPATSCCVHDWLGIQAHAVLNVPLMDNGKVAALIYAHQTAPRAWTGDDVALIKGITDRTWEAMGRTRAVAALRRLNERLEDEVRERTAQRDRMWMLSTDIMMMTTVDGTLLAVNPAWTRLLGWREDEVLGASIYDFMPPEHVGPTRDEREWMRHGGMLRNFENRYRTKDGGTVWLSWNAVPDGDVVHSVARDVTAEREQAQALQAAEAALRHAQKMEAVGQLTGGIAHDFNNLLQAISGSLELVQKRIAQGNPEGIATYAAQAQQSAERASALTHRLLAFSRRQPLVPKPVDANALILAMEPLLRRTIGEHIVLTFDLAPELWPTLCDPHQLDSAILNLAINARDAMPDGGTLTLRSRNHPGSAELPPSICIAVADTGTGMPPDVVERAFDPFYTTKPLGQGTGLGLSMVYGFMHQSGGQAHIESAPGAGTTVNLCLPRHTGTEVADDAAACPPAPTPSRRQGTVLVLEDEAVVREIVIAVLDELGLQTIEAADGPTGLEILQSARPIDLLVTDIGLPGLNGRQVAEAARLLRPDLKILFMTGYAETAAMKAGFLGEGMHMITKPFGIDLLAARVSEILA